MCWRWASLALVLTVPGYGHADSLVQWLDTFRPVAAEQGISKATWERAFAGVVEVDDRVLEKADYQPEFTSEIWDYLDARVNPIAIARGQQMDQRHSDTLAAVTRRFGVRRSVLLAIWSMESNYGAALERPEHLHYVPRALATLAYGDPKRKKFGRTQLIAALNILQAGDVTVEHFSGSWAGAMGQTQFIPTSYLAFGVDMDGDGRRDIWHSVPDALATAANLLQRSGWRSGRTWGYEVVLSAQCSKLAGQTKRLAQWQALGCTRSGGKAFPRPDEKAELKLLAGEQGPGFLMLRNFFVLKRYNNADAYALAVGLLADRLAGYLGMVQDWPRPPESLNAEEKIELQQLLYTKGYYQGAIDGNPGKVTRAAIVRFQKDADIAADGAPTQSLLLILRER
jgi:membrane-bound lytic murein transglycosylase B